VRVFSRVGPLPLTVVASGMHFLHENQSCGTIPASQLTAFNQLYGDGMPIRGILDADASSAGVSGAAASGACRQRRWLSNNIQRPKHFLFSSIGHVLQVHLFILSSNNPKERKRGNRQRDSWL
jgi:hypothetical protein